MKSAEEWAEELASDTTETKYPFCEDFVRAIQADAIKACAEKVAAQEQYRFDQAAKADEKPMKSSTLKGFYGALFCEAVQIKRDVLSLLPKDTP